MIISLLDDCKPLVGELSLGIQNLLEILDVFKEEAVKNKNYLLSSAV